MQDGANQPDTLVNDLKNVEELAIEDINFNENMYINNQGSPFNRSVLRSSQHGSFVNDYIENPYHNQNYNLMKDEIALDNEDYIKDDPYEYQGDNIITRNS